eukprot:s89_g2.t1
MADQRSERSVLAERGSLIPPAKRLKALPPAGGLKPELLFKELGVDQDPPWFRVQWNRTETDKFSAHADTNHNLFVSDTNRIVCYDREGKYQPLLTNIEPHHIVPNGTADFVVLLRKSDKQKLSKVDAKGNLATILETPSPLYGPDICPNGDVVHHPSTSRLERLREGTAQWQSDLWVAAASDYDLDHSTELLPHKSFNRLSLLRENDVDPSNRPVANDRQMQNQFP